MKSFASPKECAEAGAKAFRDELITRDSYYFSLLREAKLTPDQIDKVAGHIAGGINRTLKPDIFDNRYAAESLRALESSLGEVWHTAAFLASQYIKFYTDEYKKQHPHILYRDTEPRGA